MAFDNSACFCQGRCRATEAIELAQRGDDTGKAFAAARRAVLQAPNCPHAHGILGVLMTNGNAPLYAEHHIRLSKTLGDFPAPADVHLGDCLIGQGNLAGAENAFQQAIFANPNFMPAHVGLAKVYELRGDFEKSRAIADMVFTTDPNVPGLRVILSKCLRQADEIGNAIDVLNGINEPMALLERGKLRESIGEYDLAFMDYMAANAQTTKTYDDAEAQLRFANHKIFATRSILSQMPRLQNPIGQPVTPLFITGYPRSGTTLVETMLSQHPRIQPGDELKYVHDIAGFSQAWLGAQEPYPFSLKELLIGDKTAVARAMRAYYISKLLDVHEPGAVYMTDKMPLNEMHLPLISILFYEAPILYVRRHPLDIIVSNFATYLSHGFNQSFNLVSSAIHYSRVDDLLNHYKRKVAMNYRELRYETLVANTEPEMRGVFEFITMQYEENCARPETNTNHPRTPSYEAVRKPINDNSIGRWRHFEKYLGDIIPIVSPIIRREGY